MLYEEIECGYKDNACFVLALSNGTGTDPELYSRALQRDQGAMVDIGELVACGQGTFAQEAPDSRLAVFRTVLEEEDTRLKVYTLRQSQREETNQQWPRRLEAKKSMILIPHDDPHVDVNPGGKHVVRLLFEGAHYTRLVEADISALEKVYQSSGGGPASFRKETDAQSLTVVNPDAPITTILRNPIVSPLGSKISKNISDSSGAKPRSELIDDDLGKFMQEASRRFRQDFIFPHID